MKYVTLRGRQVEIAEKLERTTSFPAMILDRILTHTTKPHDEVIEFIVNELVRQASQNLYHPPFSGWIFASLIAQQLGWATPQKRGPVTGMSLEEIEEMRTKDPVEYYLWMEKVQSIIRIQDKGDA
jgi:hypothetical protein